MRHDTDMAQQQRQTLQVFTLSRTQQVKSAPEDRHAPDTYRHRHSMTCTRPNELPSAVVRLSIRCPVNKQKNTSSRNTAIRASLDGYKKVPLPAKAFTLLLLLSTHNARLFFVGEHEAPSPSTASDAPLKDKPTRQN